LVASFIVGLLKSGSGGENQPGSSHAAVLGDLALERFQIGELGLGPEIVD
jgi:hypothetical protein